jgi:hypothetical protein
MPLKYPQTEQQLVRAEARAKSVEDQKKDAPIARQDYWEAQEAEREKTQRLRLLRLANEVSKKVRVANEVSKNRRTGNR